jgi:hypothetical protein
MWVNPERNGRYISEEKKEIRPTRNGELKKLCGYR